MWHGKNYLIDNLPGDAEKFSVQPTSQNQTHFIFKFHFIFNTSAAHWSITGMRYRNYLHHFNYCPHLYYHNYDALAFFRAYLFGLEFQLITPEQI